ncbi:hypothetical protein [Moraxella haemolytica]|nr:hypothetical protein [Moraxella sp. ZY171148]
MRQNNFTSLTGIAHGAGTAITAGILGGVGGMAMGWGRWHLEQ